MFIFLKDFITYPFTTTKESNRFFHFLQFIAKDYPAYFWEKPSVKRIIVFPFLLVRLIFVDVPKL